MQLRMRMPVLRKWQHVPPPRRRQTLAHDYRDRSFCVRSRELGNGYLHVAAVHCVDGGRRTSCPHRMAEENEKAHDDEGVIAP